VGTNLAFGEQFSGQRNKEFSTLNGGFDTVDGIIYRSSKDESRVCYVLFVTNEECADAVDNWINDPKSRLGLVPSSLATSTGLSHLN
jgi:hypothetical protein